ncbi:MAG: hypothetical protein KDK45_07310 [Leptospiraceae bacterium]|nr:hypothetical protein [Leptospiraceae bacterium]
MNKMVSWSRFLVLSIPITSIYFYFLYYAINSTGSNKKSVEFLSITGGLFLGGLISLFLGSKASTLYSMYRKGLNREVKIGNVVTIFGKAIAEELVYSSASRDNYIYFCNGFDRQLGSDDDYIRFWVVESKVTPFYLKKNKTNIWVNPKGAKFRAKFKDVYVPGPAGVTTPGKEYQIKNHDTVFVTGQLKKISDRYVLCANEQGKMIISNYSDAQFKKDSNQEKNFFYIAAFVFFASSIALLSITV